MITSTSAIVLIVFWWFVVTVVTACIAIRIWFLISHRDSTRFVQAQDVFLVLSWAGAVSLGVTGTIILLKQQVVLNTSSLEEFETGITFILKYEWVTYIVNIFLMACTKATLFAVYLRIAGRLPAKLRILAVFGATYLGVTFVAVFFMNVFWCGADMKANWTFNEHQEICFVAFNEKIYIIVAIFSVTTDILLMATGLLIVHALEIGLKSGRERFAIFFLVIVGLVSIVASFVRFGVLWSKVSVPFTTDYTALDIDHLWFTIESMCAVISCVLPTARSILTRIPWKSWRQMSGSQATTTETQISTEPKNERESTLWRLEDTFWRHSNDGENGQQHQADRIRAQAAQVGGLPDLQARQLAARVGMLK